MRHSKFLLIIILISFHGCNSKINQIINNQREGKWITHDTLDFIYTTKGKYNKGTEIGTWKHFYKGKIVRKEKYIKSMCKTIIYHPNGKIMKKGYTKLESGEKEDHWYYFGDWYFYNTKGQLDSIKKYKKENYQE